MYVSCFSIVTFVHVRSRRVFTAVFLFLQAPVTLLDTSALRSRAQLGKKRAPRTRPSRAARQNMSAPADGDGGTNEDWLYRDSTGEHLKPNRVTQSAADLRPVLNAVMFLCSTETKVQSKDNDSDSEEPTRGADAGPAVASQPQRIALFPGMDPSALKVIITVLPETRPALLCL